MGLFGQVRGASDDVVAAVFDGCDPVGSVRLLFYGHAVTYRHGVGGTYSFDSEVPFDMRLYGAAVIQQHSVGAS